jgi:hypothetical protein
MAAPPRHGMGGSYIALLTAFYVDNGPFLPLWNRLPHWTYWLLPAIIGMPLIWRPLHRYLRSTSDKPSRARPHVVAGHETEKNMATGAVKAARVETHHHPRLDALSVQGGFTVMRWIPNRPAPCRLPAL